MPKLGEAQGVLQQWRVHGDPLPWALWLADLRERLDDPNGWSSEYHRIALAELACSGMDAEQAADLARESRPVLAKILQHEPWPVPSMWWREQIRAGRHDGEAHVEYYQALGADNERPNGTRMLATALSIMKYLNDVNGLYYATHEVPMDAAAITGTHEIRDLLSRIETLAHHQGEMSSELLASAGETVKIPESVLEENHRLRRELSELRARVESVQFQLLQVAVLAEAGAAGEPD